MSALTNKSILLLPALEQLIQKSTNGKRLKKDGKRLRSSSITGYRSLLHSLEEFEIHSKQQLRIVPINRLTSRELIREKNYWKKFYRAFTNFLYDKKKLFDNHVTHNVKLLRALFNYLENECSIPVGSFHKSFYIIGEDIPILSLDPTQFQKLIYHKEIRENLPLHLLQSLKTFIFGCTVALRFSDLMALKMGNIEQYNGKTYLTTTSKKTGTLTRILLPEYLLEELDLSRKTGPLLPQISKVNFNVHLKQLGERFGWTHEVIKTRSKRGVPQIIYKNKLRKQHYRFCDLLSSHIMRRTAITTMLMLGMDEIMVRRISGHAPNSKEFFRYVNVVQSYLDTQQVMYFERLKGM